MDNSGSQNNSIELNRIKEYFKLNENESEIGEQFKRAESNFTDNRINECLLEQSTPLETVDRIIANVSRSICKLKIETTFGTIIGTGFLLSFQIEQEMFYCLISNEHVIKSEFLKNNINIYISYDNEFKSTTINLNNNKRYMKTFTDINLDMTIVEILKEDNISKVFFLHQEVEERLNNDLINNSIYIPQYPGGKELMNAKGKIKEINKYEFTHLANTEQGSSGSPIFLENSISVIGIHKQSDINKKENYGDFIYPAINIIIDDRRKKRNNRKYNLEKENHNKVELEKNTSDKKGIKRYQNCRYLFLCLVTIGLFTAFTFKFIYDKKKTLDLILIKVNTI